MVTMGKTRLPIFALRRRGISCSAVPKWPPDDRKWPRTAFSRPALAYRGRENGCRYGGTLLNGEFCAHLTSFNAFQWVSPFRLAMFPGSDNHFRALGKRGQGVKMLCVAILGLPAAILELLNS